MDVFLLPLVGLFFIVCVGFFDYFVTDSFLPPTEKLRGAFPYKDFWKIAVRLQIQLTGIPHNCSAIPGPAWDNSKPQHALWKVYENAIVKGLLTMKSWNDGMRFYYFLNLINQFFRTLSVVF